MVMVAVVCLLKTK